MPFNNMRIRSVMNYGRVHQPDVNTHDVGGSIHRLRRDDVALVFDCKRDEPAACATGNRCRQDAALEAALRRRLFEPNTTNPRQANVSFLERNLIQPGRVVFAFTFQARRARPRRFAVHASEETIECLIEIDNGLLADVRRDLVQPRALSLLQLDQSRLQLRSSRASPAEFERPPRLCKAPVVNEARRADALRQRRTLRSVRVELETKCLPVWRVGRVGRHWHKHTFDVGCFANRVKASRVATSSR